jgi:hypothetical protein
MVARVRSPTAAHERGNVSDTGTTVYLRNMQPGYQCNINSYCTTRFPSSGFSASNFLRSWGAARSYCRRCKIPGTKKRQASGLRGERYKASTHSREEIYVTILIIACRLNTVLGICIDDEDHQAHPSTSSVGRAIVVGDYSCVVESPRPWVRPTSLQ